MADRDKKKKKKGKGRRPVYRGAEISAAKEALQQAIARYQGEQAQGRDVGEFLENALRTQAEVLKRGDNDPLLKLNEDMTGQFATNRYPHDQAFWWDRGGSNRERANRPGAFAPMPKFTPPDRGARQRIVDMPQDQFMFPGARAGRWRA